MASLPFMAFSNTWIKSQQHTQWRSQGITALKFVALVPASKKCCTHTHKLLPRPYLAFPLVSTSLSGLRLAVANVQWRFASDLQCLPTAALRKRQPGAYENREQISQQNISSRAYRQDHMGILLIDGLAVLQCFKLLKISLWKLGWKEGGLLPATTELYRRAA